MPRDQGKIGKKSADQIAAQIRAELRGILRLRDELRTPLQRFQPVEPTPAGGPSFYVTFDLRPRRRIKGLKLGGIQRLSLPDEQIKAKVAEFTKAVWHLKDRLHQWVRVLGGATDVDAFATCSKELLICADLANLKKHGRNENRSKLNPQLGNVDFDTSKNGHVEMFYAGASKDKEVIVQHPVPIPYSVQLLIHDGTASMGDAVEIVARGFEAWLPLIRQLGVLEGDAREERFLSDALFPQSSPERS